MKTKTKILLIILSFLITKNATAYNYNGRELNIVVPENITYLEYCYYSGNCEVSKRNKKLIKVNELLVRKGFTSLY